MKINQLVEAYNAASEKVTACAKAWDALPDRADAETIKATKSALDESLAFAEHAHEAVEAAKSVAASRDRFTPEPISTRQIALAEGGIGRVSVDEPDRYVKGGRSFLLDLYSSQLKHDVAATERITSHHLYEVEKYAVATGTLGGIIPPQYLIELYAKASRNGRVFCDNGAKHQDLPDVGMSLIVPRLTQGLAAGSQASESSAASTQDPTETDLSVPVRTIAGYSPVSRQTLERAAYSDVILFEDLVARYYASLDSGCLNGAGTGGTILGLLATSGISASTAGTATIAGVYPKVFDCFQQIAGAVGGLGYMADALFLHPRRWAWFAASLDTQGRPLMVPEGNVGGVAMNVIATGSAVGYGGPVGRLGGLPVFLDANIPTNLGAGTNQDAIIVVASQTLALWERPDDPVTLSFEQQAGTSLQVQLVAYGYAAFTAGRYPAGSAAITGAGLVPPTF